MPSACQTRQGNRPRPGRSPRPGRPTRWRPACTALLLLAGCAGAGDRPAAPAASDAPAPPAAAAAAPGAENPAGPEDGTRPGRAAADWGVQVLGIHRSAGGHMLDFRYRITDPQRAAVFLDRSVRPYLIDQASGRVMQVPVPAKVGPLRQTSPTPRTDRTYFMMFANPGRFITPGSRVTVAVGDCRLEDLIVE